MAGFQCSRWCPVLISALLALAAAAPFTIAADKPTPRKPAAPPAAGGTVLPLGPLATPSTGQPAAAPKPAAGAPKASATPAKEPEERKPEKLTLKHSGRPEGKELDVSSRYYLWTDPDGWHLRSGCKSGYFAGFQGEVAITGGTFKKIRPIGIDLKGSHPDSWALNQERTKLVYDMYTGGTFDGFDFTVDGKDAVLTFDMKIAKKEKPKQIYIGKDNLHPKSAFFELPAEHK